MSHLKSLKKITSKIEDYKLKKEKKEKKKFEIHSFFFFWLEILHEK